MNWLIAILIWITFTWDPVPGAVAYRIEASNNHGNTWSQLSYGATTKVTLSLPTNMGIIFLRWIVIHEQIGKDKINAVSWRFDPTLGIPHKINLGIE